MRIKTLDDLNALGLKARQAVTESLLKSGATLSGSKNVRHTKGKAPIPKQENAPSKKKNNAPSRVKRNEHGYAFCPWPSTDPFVKVHQFLEEKYGRYADGGMLVTEMIIEGGEKPWRFDFALVPRLMDATITSQSTGAQPVLLGPSCVLIEADGFGYHKSKDAFKNDRAKQTHALKSGFVVKRITNDDARNRLDTILIDIDTILLHQRIYYSDYTIAAKGYTQSVFSWTKKTP